MPVVGSGQSYFNSNSDNHDTSFGCIRNYENEVSMKYNAIQLRASDSVWSSEDYTVNIVAGTAIQLLHLLLQL
jgi:hypothetical protein